MNDFRVRWVATAALASVLAAGCVKTRPTLKTTQPTTTQSSETTASAGARVRELSALSEEYSALSHQLPGSTPEEHRELMRTVFDKLDQILPMFMDPGTDLVFRQQLMVIEDARAHLSAAPPDLTVEPTIDTALRTAHSALAGIARKRFEEQTELAAPLDQMNQKLGQLDAVHGLTHQVIVSEVVEASSGVINKLTELLAQKIAASAASGPSTSPSTSPATEGK